MVIFEQRLNIVLKQYCRSKPNPLWIALQAVIQERSERATVGLISVLTTYLWGIIGIRMSL